MAALVQKLREEKPSSGPEEAGLKVAKAVNRTIGPLNESGRV